MIAWMPLPLPTECRRALSATRECCAAGAIRVRFILPIFRLEPIREVLEIDELGVIMEWPAPLSAIVV
jgi:hypothetical protein